METSLREGGGQCRDDQGPFNEIKKGFPEKFHFISKTNREIQGRLKGSQGVSGCLRELEVFLGRLKDFFFIDEIIIPVIQDTTRGPA